MPSAILTGSPVDVGVSPAVAQFRLDAAAVAFEHGHTLRAWYSTPHLEAAAFCENCSASVCWKAEGFGSNLEPMRFIVKACRPVLDRFYVVKCSRYAVYYVKDRPQPGLAAKAWARKRSDAEKIAARLNGAPVVDELAKMRAKVARLRVQLANAEAALEVAS